MVNQQNMTTLQEHKEELLMVHALVYVPDLDLLQEEPPVLPATQLLLVFLNPNWLISEKRMKN